MTSQSLIGQWVWGEALNPCQVVAIGSKRSTGQTMLKVCCRQGARVIPLESVKGVAQQKPNLLVMPRPIQIGDRVRLKGTQAEYVVIEIYSHFMGWEDGDRTYEQWARLQTDNGKPATWKIQQLEAVI
jgi:D-serine deaminase-like pyridoxal phosphate-dependent protein